MYTVVHTTDTLLTCSQATDNRMILRALLRSNAHSNLGDQRPTCMCVCLRVLFSIKTKCVCVCVCVLALDVKENPGAMSSSGELSWEVKATVRSVSYSGDPQHAECEAKHLL